jgi:DNA-binding transcriptional ArsR family regulator
MVEHRSLNGVFAAISDPTRRAILTHLGRRPARVTDIARRFPMSLNAVSKHLIVLERAGLIVREAHGRERICSLNAQRFREASLWMDGMREFWEARFDALEAHIARKRKARP